MKTTNTPKSYLNSKDRFVIENYNLATTFTNFFPGIAGLWGIPMWAFYVNRGQGISSFGIEGKDKAIMEFHPANQAYQTTSLKGFRTFLKIRSGSKNLYYEPFQSDAIKGPFKTHNRMEISSHDMSIEETNETLGIVVRVNYFTLPEEPYAGLVRKLTVKNISKKKYDIDILDGMPALMPYGLNDWFMKHMSRTAEAWHQVANIGNKAPFFNLKVVINDRPQVEHIHAGHFFFAFKENDRKKELLDVIVDPTIVFGPQSDLMRPDGYLSQNAFKIPAKQRTLSSTPCAFSVSQIRLTPKSEATIVSLFGHTFEIGQVEGIVRKTTQPGYIESKSKRNADIVTEIKNHALTVSASNEFNLYCGQTFLDNVMRGGLPVSLETSHGKVTLSVFNRKHGDPERDYNNFVIAPTYLSQGNGNYRDVNQNRRMDNWFNTDVKDSDVINFLSLIQPDGYNPLVIKGTMFEINNPKKIDDILKESFTSKSTSRVRELLEKGFLPGKLIAEASLPHTGLKIGVQEFLKNVLSHCRKAESAEHGEGFWTDHWTYNLDLIESYLALYPEEHLNILINRDVFSFYHDGFHVVPRDHRYVLTRHGCRQLHSVVDGAHHKTPRIDNKMRIKNGEGEIYHTTLIAKLLCLIANKTATFDPSGVGIEMEADKPNWYDALNGLPGLVGSSISETFELKRLSLFLLDSLEILELSDDQNIKLFDELYTFITALNEILSSESDPYAYWMKSNTAKEDYRARVRFGIDGKEKSMNVGAIKKFLDLVVAKTDKAIEEAKREKGLLTTYLTHEIVEYQKLEKHSPEGFPFVQPKSFKRHDLPLFLEGFVHALRVEKNSEKAFRLYEAVYNSELFDRKLKMYRVNGDLSGESENIGRTRVFPSGWLENGSIWLHMEYKFLLELLRSGLHEEYFDNFKKILVPFLNPQKYGRSILENSSFIASSSHENPDFHGRGFVARLSGTTVELLHLWLLMNVGENPFSLDQKSQLKLSFKPILPDWLFTKAPTTIDVPDKSGQKQKISFPKNIYAFNFLGSTLVVYHNPKRLHTYGPRKASVRKITLTYPDKRQMTLSSDLILSPYALEIREHKVSRIDLFLE